MFGFCNEAGFKNIEGPQLVAEHQAEGRHHFGIVVPKEGLGGGGGLFCVPGHVLSLGPHLGPPPRGRKGAP